MWLTVEHVTRFSYDAPIAEAYTELRLKPAHRDGQRCSSFTLETEPRGATIDEYVDRFGSAVHHFDVLEAHERLVVTARSEVWTREGFTDPTRPFAARPVGLSGAVALRPGGRRDRRAGRARDVGPRPGGGGSRADARRALARSLRAGVDRRPHDGRRGARRHGRGVCQDFAHVMIGACRARGIPARYVSGYLHDPDSGGAGESHAWVDVHVGEDGWLSLDPTHDTEQTDRYVRVGVGRDYADVPPSRGVYKGSARRRRSRSRSRSASPEPAATRDERGMRRGERCQCASRSQRPRSGSPIAFETTRTSTAGTPARAAARSTPNPSIASTSGPCNSLLQSASDRRRGVDRHRDRGRKRATGELDEATVGATRSTSGHSASRSQ